LRFDRIRIMSKPGSFGTCALCGARKGKAAMVAHLKGCLASQPAAKVSGLSDVLLLRAQARGPSIYWVDVAMKREAMLSDLDRLLRRIWLECCGHLSEFYGNGHRKVSMRTRVGGAFFAVGDRLGYEYDFGSSTELVVSLSGSAEGRFGSPAHLVARNEAPTWPCEECGQPATAVCTQCAYEGKGFCCAEHAAGHGCGEEMMLPVVNSPRMGVCGYTGEAVRRA
jgi:hypothetical protein